jgi:predicted RNA polymerase sigma factor
LSQKTKSPTPGGCSSVLSPSTRAELLRRLGRDDEARTAYQRAVEMAQTEPERRLLRSRLDELNPPDGQDVSRAAT